MGFRFSPGSIDVTSDCDGSGFNREYTTTSASNVSRGNSWGLDCNRQPSVESNRTVLTAFFHCSEKNKNNTARPWEEWLGPGRFEELALQQLHAIWEEHAVNMDHKGRRLLQTLEELHGQALKVRECPRDSTKREKHDYPSSFTVLYSTSV